MKTSNRSIFIKCDCTCNVIELEHICEDDMLNITLWKNSISHKPLSKKERIRWCDNIMKTGNPWADHTIVNKQDAKRIVEFLNKYINHGKTQTNKH